MEKIYDMYDEYMITSSSIDHLRKKAQQIQDLSSQCCSSEEREKLVKTIKQLNIHECAVFDQLFEYYDSLADRDPKLSESFYFLENLERCQRSSDYNPYDASERVRVEQSIADINGQVAILPQSIKKILKKLKQGKELEKYLSQEKTSIDYIKDKIGKKLSRTDRIYVYTYYADKLKHQIQPIMRDLKHSEHPKANDFSDQYEKIEEEIESTLEKAAKGKCSLFDCGAMFSDTCHKKRKADEKELIRSIRSLDTLVNECESQIRADERRKAEKQAWDRLWPLWEEQRREKLHESLQSIERELQEKQRDIQLSRNLLQKIEYLNVGSIVLDKLLHTERYLLHKLMSEDLMLQGEITVLNEELNGLPHERLRWQIRQRVDEMLSRQPAQEQLRHQVLELQKSVLRDYRELEPEEKLLKAEFQGVLEEQMMHHDRPEQERIDILGDLTGIRPQH